MSSFTYMARQYKDIMFTGQLVMLTYLMHILTVERQNMFLSVLYQFLFMWGLLENDIITHHFKV